jgi:hypothetical protein
MCQSFDLLPPTIFGFQVLKIKQCISTNGADPSLLVDHRLCSKDGKIILCDIDVSQGNHVQKVDESLQRPRSLASQVCLQLRFPKVFAMFLLPVPGQSSS